MGVDLPLWSEWVGVGETRGERSERGQSRGVIMGTGSEQRQWQGREGGIIQGNTLGSDGGEGPVEGKGGRNPAAVVRSRSHSREPPRCPARPRGIILPRAGYIIWGDPVQKTNAGRLAQKVPIKVLKYKPFFFLPLTSFAHIHSPLSPWTSLTKHKFKGKMKNSKSATAKRESRCRGLWRAGPSVTAEITGPSSWPWPCPFHR